MSTYDLDTSYFNNLEKESNKATYLLKDNLSKQEGVLDSLNVENKNLDCDIAGVEQDNDNLLNGGTIRESSNLVNSNARNKVSEQIDLAPLGSQNFESEENLSSKEIDLTAQSDDCNLSSLDSENIQEEKVKWYKSLSFWVCILAVLLGGVEGVLIYFGVSFEINILIEGISIVLCLLVYFGVLNRGKYNKENLKEEIKEDLSKSIKEKDKENND